MSDRKNLGDEVFDPVAASATMRVLAEFAQHCAENGIQLQPDFARKALGELRAAEAWLYTKLEDFGISERRPLISEEDAPGGIGPAALSYTLRYAAIELLQVHKLLELRSLRSRR